MFFTTNFNEGGIDENRIETKRRELLEGENPKSIGSSTNTTDWHCTKECSHVNSNWQKLRK
ncbi:MAG: hypothetical protein HQ522_09150 [Bacteroidetes bacterium]|nr:hypothetical protein [Bacteroidota bacterium]